MRKISTSILAVILLLITSSCEKIKDATTFEIEPTFTSLIECKVPAILNSTTTAVFGASTETDPRSDSKVNVYLNSIQGYEIKSMTATVTSMSRSNITLLSGDLMIKNFNRQIIWTLQQELMAVGKTITLNNDKGQLNELSQTLKDGQEFNVIITGVADFSDVSFTIKVEIKTVATVKLI